MKKTYDKEHHEIDDQTSLTINLVVGVMVDVVAVCSRSEWNEKWRWIRSVWTEDITYDWTRWVRDAIDYHDYSRSVRMRKQDNSEHDQFYQTTSFTRSNFVAVTLVDLNEEKNIVIAMVILKTRRHYDWHCHGSYTSRCDRRYTGSLLINLLKKMTMNINTLKILHHLRLVLFWKR